MASKFNARLAGVSVLAALSLVLTACGGGSAQQGPEADDRVVGDNGFAVYTGPPQEGGTLTAFVASEFSSLDPAMGNDGGVNNFYNLIYRQLTQYTFDPLTEEYELVGDLATDAGTPNEDATVWTFTLKDDIFFEDGTPITAEDVKFGIERSFDSALAVGFNEHYIIEGADEYAGAYDDPAGLDSIEVPDEKTIIFHLERPSAGFGAMAVNPPFTPFPAGEIDAQQLGEQPFASGPYRVESYQRGESLTLVRNEHWVRESDPIRAAHLDGYEFLFGLDQSTVDQRMISDQGNDKNAMMTTGILPANLAQVTSNEQLAHRTIQALPSCTVFLNLNTTHEVLSDVRVRQGISYLINRTSVVTATGGPALAGTASDMLLPNTPERDEFDLYPSEGDNGDLEAAQALFDEAGVDPSTVTFTMDVRALPKWQAQAESVQQSLESAGFGVDLNVIDSATYYEVIGTPAKANELAITGWCSPTLSGSQLLTPLFHGDSIHETGNYNGSLLDDETINARFDEIATIADPDEQHREYAALNREILELAPVVPLIRETPLTIMGSNVGGAFAHPGRYGYVDLASLGLLDPEA